jgi:hypothetical protein
MEVVNTTTTTDPVNMYNYLNNLILNPTVFIIIFLIITIQDLANQTWFYRISTLQRIALFGQEEV